MGRHVLIILYIGAFFTGAIVMSFEMLGSRYLNPYFGSGIYTWSALISTVLTALAVGYFLGGWLADYKPFAIFLVSSVIAGSIYLVLLPIFADHILEAVVLKIDNVKIGSLFAALALTFPPIAFLGVYSPFAIKLALKSTENSGSITGMIFGFSTIGSIIGTWATTFILIPNFGSRTITVCLGVTGIVVGALLFFMRLPSLRKVPAQITIVLLLFLLFLNPSLSATDEFIDQLTRRATLSKPDGQIAHIETEYNDIFITKFNTLLTMSFQRYSQSYTESVTNLVDDFELPVLYTQTMTIGAAYPKEVRRALMIGLGGGSLSTYLAHYIPNLTIDNVEVDPGVISAAQKYFGLKESKRVRFIESDGRVFLMRNHNQYDLILIDAFRGGYVPFHLLTKEFYLLLKQRLCPDGVAVFNIHSGTKLYPSTILTLKSVFPSVDLFLRSGSIIVIVSSETQLDSATILKRASAAQKRFQFRYAMETLLADRIIWPEGTSGNILTDDFAPADVYDVIKVKNRKQW